MASNKHHYIPKCYLKPWTGADGELCEYQFLGSRVVTKRRHPSATGWVANLYSVSGLPPEYADIIETEVFGRVDQGASDALDIMIKGGSLRPGREMDGFSRFVMSLLFRNPEAMAEVKTDVLRRWNSIEWSDGFVEEDPEGYADFLLGENGYHFNDLFVDAIRNACDMQKIGNILNNMHKGALVLTSHHRFMTSDNPLFVSGGLGMPDAHVMLPLTPRKLYIAATDKSVVEEIVKVAKAEMITEFMNNHVVSQSNRFAYGVCENHLAMVSKIWNF